MTKLLCNLFFVIFLTSAVSAEKFTVAGINFESPESWESSEPSNNMRKAQFSASSPSGKSAEVVFSTLIKNTGGIQANVDRWMKQLRNHLAKKWIQ